MSDIPDMAHVYSHDPYEVYAAIINVGLADAYVSSVVVHDTLQNQYITHMEGWFRSSDSASTVFEYLVSHGYTYENAHPSDSAIETVKKLHNINPYDETHEDKDEDGFVYLVFIPVPERVVEDGFGEFYKIRGIH